MAIVLALLLGLSSLTAGAAQKEATALRCLSAKAVPATTLPAKLDVGVETIHRDPQKIITIFVPLAPDGTPSRVLDTNSKKPEERLPEVFAISDGTLKTPFIGVDHRPGSRLDLCIGEIAARATGASKDPASAAYAFIRDRLQADYLREPPRGYHFGWDRPAAEADPADLTELFRSAKDMPVGQYPLRSKQTHRVVALEEFLRKGHGTCLHKALLASLVLEKLKIPHRLVNGAMRSGGHTWIALPDGRILDPSMHKLARAEKMTQLPGWIRYGDQHVFENQVWPYLALP